MEKFLKELKTSDYLELFSHALNYTLGININHDDRKVEVAKAYVVGIEHLLNKHGYEVVKKEDGNK